MNLSVCTEPAAVAARLLKEAFDGTIEGGIFGTIQTMPEEEACRGIESELDRLLLLTLTVAIDYQRDAHALWAHARALHDDLSTRWVFQPAEVDRRSPRELRAALASKGRLRYPDNDTDWWRHNCRTLHRQYGGDPRRLFEQCKWDALSIAQEVRSRRRFKGLGGQKIFPLWLRMVSDILRYRFHNLDTLPIPADIHIVRASFAIGLLRGRYRGPLDNELKDIVRQAWADLGGQLDGGWTPYDEPLWQLSRLGCEARHGNGHPDCPKRPDCPIQELCVRGVVKVYSKFVEIDT